MSKRGGDRLFGPSLSNIIPLPPDSLAYTSVWLHRLRTGRASAAETFSLIPSIYSTAPLEDGLYKISVVANQLKSFELVGRFSLCTCAKVDETCNQKNGLGLSQILWDSFHGQVSGQSTEGLSITVEIIDEAKVPVAHSLTLQTLSHDINLYSSYRFPPIHFEDAKSQDFILQLKAAFDGAVIARGQMFALIYRGELLICTVANFAIKKSKSILSASTLASVNSKCVSISLTAPEARVPEATNLGRSSMGLSKVGGLRSAIQAIEETLLYPLLHPEIFFTQPGEAKLRGLSPPRGLLLHGIPGTGKSFLVGAIAEELRTRWHKRGSVGEGWQCPRVARLDSTVLGPDSREGKLEEVFELCKRAFHNENRTTLLIIDEIDAICAKRTEASSDWQVGMTNALLIHLDGVDSHPGVTILATTNRPDSLDEALRRPGRLDREIEMEVPMVDERGEILLKLLEKFGIKVDGVQSLSEAIEICRKAHGFVCSDLELWVSRAVQLAQSEFIRSHEFDESLLAASSIVCTSDHLERTLPSIRPSALKELAVQVPDTRWSDIGGYEMVKRSLQECVEWPVKYWNYFDRLKIFPPKGILLYGPPGNSKTIMAKAVASESSMNFISVKGPEIFSKWVGESERTIRTLFRKARQHAPTIIFFDEIDALGGDRQSASGQSGSVVESRVLSQLLTEMDGVGAVKQVVVIGATNRPDLMDAALLRPGRFDRLIYVPLPDECARREVFRVHLRSITLVQPAAVVDGPKSTDLYVPWSVTEAAAWLSDKTDGFSGAEIAMICNEARMNCLRRTIFSSGNSSLETRKEDFESILSNLKPRTPTEMIKFYDTYSQQQGGASSKAALHLPSVD